MPYKIKVSEDRIDTFENYNDALAFVSGWNFAVNGYTDILVIGSGVQDDLVKAGKELALEINSTKAGSAREIEVKEIQRYKEKSYSSRPSFKKAISRFFAPFASILMFAFLSINPI